MFICEGVELTGEDVKVFAIVVTYNRLNLLKENLNALQEQSYKLAKILIINNNSSDGTKEYLDEYFGKKDGFEVINLDKNLGGAGGFYEGIKKSVNLGCDWVWVMDDDTIPLPDSLEKLMDKTDITNDIGFLGSRVLFTDGTPHIMNNNPPATNDIRKIQWNSYLDKGVLSLNYNSFVSCLINSKAVQKVGLPYKDFFIWGDDQEYTQRIIDSNFYGGLVLDSIVFHKTKENYGVILSTATDSLSWKYYYGERNRVFLERQKRSNLNFLLWFLYYKYKTNKTLRKISGNKKLKRAVRKGLRTGLFFNPRIDYV